MRRLPWFEDFNDHAARPEAVAEDPPPPTETPSDPLKDAWTEGFLAGCRATSAGAAHLHHDVAATFTRRVTEMAQELAAMADQSAATMGGLLIDILATAVPPGPPADKLNDIVAAIRPIFALEPRLHVRPGKAGEVKLHDLPALYKAMDAGDWELAVRWHQPGAEIDPSKLAASLGALTGSCEP
jgi:hypothetical protein